MNRVLFLFSFVTFCGFRLDALAGTGADGLATEVRTQLASGGTRVELRDRGITRESLRELLKLEELRTVTELDLSGNPLGVDGAEDLARASDLRSLRVLRLERCQLGYVGAKALAALLALPELRELHVASNEFGDTGAAAMVYTDKLLQLEVLDLRHNGISDQGGKRFLESDGLGPQVRLELGGNDKISEAVRAALRERYGDRVNFEVKSP